MRGSRACLSGQAAGASLLFPPQHPDAESAQEALLHVLRRDPHQYGHKCQRWTLDLLRQACGWLRLRTMAGLSRLLKRLLIHHKRGRMHVHSPDADYLAKLKDIRIHVQRSKANPEQNALLFMDECTYYRQPTLAEAYEISGHRQPLAEMSYKSNSTWRIVATLDVWTGQVVYTQRQKIGVNQLVAFYRKVRAAYPLAETIYVVQDNWPVHFHPDVLAALQPQELKWPLHIPGWWPKEPSGLTKPYNLPIQVIQLPTYASWANPIEKLWRWLHQDVLHLHTLADAWTELRGQVAAFLGQFAQGSRELLQYVGLRDPDKLYHSAFPMPESPNPLRC